MPTTLKKNKGIRRTQGLFADLIAALGRSGLPESEPFIIENQVGQTKTAHVVVIWDAWKDWAPAERSKIILDAYAQTKRLDDATITLSLGLADEEALRMGFLPYAIIVTRRSGDKVSLNKLSRAMETAGGIVVKIGSSTQLRFPTQEHAEDAYRRLTQEVPGPYWAIVHEQSATD